MGLWEWLRGKKTEAPSPALSLHKGLEKSRRTFWERLRDFFGSRAGLEAADQESLEELLLSADVGPTATQTLLQALEASLRTTPLGPNETLLDRLKVLLIRLLEVPFEPPEGQPYVILFVGVNGVGKTTTVARLAYRLKTEGKKVLLGAADTFRAAAIEQLHAWSTRLGIPLVEKGMGADPGAVTYEAIQKAIKEQYDVVLIDTAGRLHTRTPLMQELAKVYRVAGKALAGAPHEVLLVVDATTGQNALRQAEVFQAATHCTGLVLTKLDGTAKGGIAFALVAQTKLPIRFIGVGESAEDLLPFSAQDFVESLLAKN
ncbi:MAG: signal recognition particle-docking protein FtsY [Bacteroidia bacterium]|nr:signal recognition particle-docking protein FtsY [Bacteroidia bacterium]MDW8088530.1 signal recognition particle-docking protein FtsY [Bacteroidia bacterium]